MRSWDISIKEKLWSRLPEYAQEDREETVAIVFHWGRSWSDKIGRCATLEEMHSYYSRTLEDHSYHAFVGREIWQTMRWEAHSGALGLPRVKLYPPEATRRFRITGWSSVPDWKVINILLFEDDEEGTFSSETLANGHLLGAYLCDMFDLSPTRDFLRHSDVTHKGIRDLDHPLYSASEDPCPKRFVEYPEDWTAFITKTYEILCLKSNGTWFA